MEQFEQLRRQIGEVVCLRVSCRLRVRPILHAVEERYCGQERIPVQRVKCPRCGRTFRLLPEWVVPYKTAAVAEVEAVVSAWQRRRSYRGVARGLGMCIHAVRRWVRWWQVVAAVTEAQRARLGTYEAGWLRQLLREFRCWRGRWNCEWTGS